MQIGVITVDGRSVGTVTFSFGDNADTFIPDLEGYEPQGRADRSEPGAPSSDHAGARHRHRHGGEGAAPGEKTVTEPGEKSGRHRPGHHEPAGDKPVHHDHEMAPRTDRVAPKGEEYKPAERDTPLHRQGSAETDQAIVEAAKAHNLDPNFMRSIASIESSMNPSSNANRATQYKGLFQMGSRGPKSEWARFGGGGNIYSARDNAMAAARYFDANRKVFRQHFGRDPTDTEMYMMHQQGLGFYTRGAMTNIQGNLPRSERGKPQTHESFEAVWGREVARHKAGFNAAHPDPVATEGLANQPVGPQSSIDKPYKVASADDKRIGAPSAAPPWEEGDPEYTVLDKSSKELDDVGTTNTLKDFKDRPSEPGVFERSPDAKRTFQREHPGLWEKMQKEKKDREGPTHIFPPTPGDENDPAKTGEPDQFSIPPDYDIG